MTTRATEPELGTSSASQFEATQPHLIDVKTKQQKRVPDENIAKLVAEENESKSKFPHYPGLERWELVEKMGDGAFSNVYRARDREGGTAEVAIKVVRKFEMNSMQVRDVYGGRMLFIDLFSFARRCLVCPLSQVPFTNTRAPFRARIFSIPTLSRRRQRQQRCEKFLFINCTRHYKRLPEDTLKATGGLLLPRQAPGM